MSTFVFACNAVLPIILLILLGYYLRRRGIYNESFLEYGNRFVFQVALPALLFYNVYSIEKLQAISWSVVVYGCGMTVVVFLIGIFFVCLYTKDRRKRGVLLQCIFRSNFAIIGIPLAESIGGSGGMKVAAVLSAFSIPIYNMLAVIALSMFQTEGLDKREAIRQVGSKIYKNPLIRGVFLGLICLGIRNLLPKDESTGKCIITLQDNLPFVYQAVKSVGAIASPFALIVLGGNFHFEAVRGLAKDIAFGTLWRVAIVPAVALSVAIVLSAWSDVFHFTYVEYPALIALFGSPVAVASAIMAKEMNGDDELARQLVMWTSICSMFTIFITIVILKGIAVL